MIFFHSKGLNPKVDWRLRTRVVNKKSSPKNKKNIQQKPVWAPWPKSQTFWDQFLCSSRDAVFGNFYEKTFNPCGHTWRTRGTCGDKEGLKTFQSFIIGGKITLSERIFVFLLNLLKFRYWIEQRLYL